MHDRAELAGVVVVEPEGQAETITERRRQQTRACRRPDERERRQIERQRARSRTFAHHDVDAKVLERRVEDLLRRAAHPVDLVHEQHVARLERGEDRGDVLLLDGGAGNRPDADAELLVDDVRERGLAEAGRPGEQHVVERLTPRLRSNERDVELLLHALLADEIGERARPERLLDRVLVILQRGGHERAHAPGRPSLPRPGRSSAKGWRRSAKG